MGVGGVVIAGGGSAGVGIYYANQNSGQPKSPEEPGKPEAQEERPAGHSVSEPGSSRK